MKRWIIFLAFSSLFILATGVCFGQKSKFNWYKGQTHLHTTNSDGDETPRRVVRWYRDHGYHFIVITDHDCLTDPSPLDSDPQDDFILIPGDEVTDKCEGKPVHINGINIREVVLPQHGETITATLQNNVDAIRAAGGIAHINHPNWRRAFGSEEISAVKGASLLELFNITRDSNNYAAGGQPGMEQVWDGILSRGVLIYGTITDDAHNYLGDFTPDRANPGRGWVMVRADELNPDKITRALETGDFYSTTGVLLADIQIDQQVFGIEIQEEKDFSYTTTFIGQDGNILKEDYSTSPRYPFTGREKYVRAKVFCSSGEVAFVQPVRLSD